MALDSHYRWYQVSRESLWVLLWCEGDPIHFGATAPTCDIISGEEFSESILTDSGCSPSGGVGKGPRLQPTLS